MAEVWASKEIRKRNIKATGITNCGDHKLVITDVEMERHRKTEKRIVTSWESGKQLASTHTLATPSTSHVCF